MVNLQQIKNTSAQVYLTLDNPQSVKNQLQRLNQAQQQLKEFKQQVVAQLQELNQPTNSFGLDEMATIGLHLLGKHQIARQVNRQGNIAEKRQRRQQQQARQPYIKMQNLIDNYLFECDRLKTMGQNYLQQHQQQ
ncbi:MAG: hypothetical protein Tsb0014_22450 [Pleurocapsa sp.]